MLGKSTYGFTLALTFFFGVTAHALQYVPFVKNKNWKLHSEVSYFSSTANYDTEGSSFTKLPNNQSYSKTDIQIDSYYSLGKKWTLLSGVSYGYGKSLGNSLTRSNSKLTDFQIGASYLWETKPLIIIPIITTNIPIATVDKGTDDLILNEGSLDLVPKVWISRKIFNMQAYAEPGLLLRNEGRSHLFTLRAGLIKRFKSIELGAEYNLESAFSDDDTFSTPSVKQTVTNRVNAGSLKYYSVNPELHSAKLWANYKWNKKIALQIGYDKTLNGKNTANGSTIFAAITWNIKNPVSFKKNKKEQFQPEEEALEGKAKEYFNYDPEVDNSPKKQKSR